MENNIIENYAQSLLQHKLYSTITMARKEAKRWYKKHINDFEEPLQCPHRPDFEFIFTIGGNFETE